MNNNHELSKNIFSLDVHDIPPLSSQQDKFKISTSWFGLAKNKFNDAMKSAVDHVKRTQSFRKWNVWWDQTSNQTSGSAGLSEESRKQPDVWFLRPEKSRKEPDIWLHRSEESRKQPDVSK